MGCDHLLFKNEKRSTLPIKIFHLCMLNYKQICLKQNYHFAVCLKFSFMYFKTRRETTFFLAETIFWANMCTNHDNIKKKSRIRETLNMLPCADSSTDTKKTPKSDWTAAPLQFNAWSSAALQFNGWSTAPMDQSEAWEKKKKLIPRGNFWPFLS